MPPADQDTPNHVAGRLLRELRTRRGWSQREMARITGITQSVLSAYETSRRQPSVATLIRIIEACGSRLDLVIREHGTQQPADRK